MSTEGSDPQRHGDRWFVQMFGGLRLSNGSHQLATWPPTAQSLLLARLLLETEARPRDELAAWLWPVIRPRNGRSSEDATRLRRTRMRDLLSKLDGRLFVEGLPPGGALLREGGVRLNPAAFDTELQQFHELLARRRLDQAAALLGRGLLPHLQGPWFDAQRARLGLLLDRAASDGLPALDDIQAAPTRPAGGFFGRHEELTQLRAWLQSQRLIAITGAGGSGKTRLAHQLLAQLTDFGTQAFVALARHHDSSRLLEHIRDTLQIQPGAQEPLKQLVTRLSGQRALLVLDNFEQFADEAGERSLLALLQALPRLHLVLTSTRGLRTPLCSVYALQPLAVPEAGADLLSAQSNPAVALFVERAAEVRPGFRLTARNRASVVDVCRAVEGLPLAVELAALRVRQVAPREMAQALQRSYAMLVRSDPGARRNLRHASLQAVLDWCFSLLDAGQQKALMQLAHLRGAFTAEQAACVLGRRDARPLLATLLRDSMLRMHAEAGGAMRWRLPTAQREHAAERCPKRLAAAAALRHRNGFAALAATPAAQSGRLAAADLPDLVAAGHAASQGGLHEVAVRIALALARHAAARGTLPEALDFLQQVATDIAPDAPGHAELRGLLPPLYVDAGRAQAAQLLAERAVEQAGKDPLLRAEALFALTHTRWRADRNGQAAYAPTLQCLLLARRAQQSLTRVRMRVRALQARVLALAGALKLQLGRGHLKAMASFKAAGRRFGESGDPRDTLRIVPGIAACQLQAQSFEQVFQQTATAELQAIELGDVGTQLLLCNRQGEALGELKRYAEALAVNRRQVQVARRHGMAYHLAYGLWNQCLLLVKEREPAKAAVLMGFSRHYWESQFGPLNAEDKNYVQRVRRLVIAQTNAADWRHHVERGAALDDAEAMRLGSE